MPCYRPLTAWRGPMLASGKRSVVFKPSESTGGLVAFPQKLPCGQCIGCRLDYSLDWATRCLHEAEMHKENCFITLTYDDVHLPKSGSLEVSEWQRFMKRFRKAVGVPLRFFHAGEYGERFGRPHYHALIFGYDFPDRQLLKTTQSGSSIYTSRILSSIWNLGYSSVGDVTFESAAYVARYCVKKVTGKGLKIPDKVTGLLPYDRVLSSGEIVSVKSEYVTMSRGRRPDGGIGYSWYQKFKNDVFPHGYCVVRGGVKMPPPRYYDRLYELDNPLDFRRIKCDRVSRCSKREVVWNDVLHKNQVLDVSRDDRLVVMEECAEARLKLLSKKLESGQ